MGPPWQPCLPGSKGDYRCSGQPRKSWATETLTKILTLLPGNHQQQHNLCSFDYLLQWVYSDRLCTSILLISLWHESCAESCKRMSCSGKGEGCASTSTQEILRFRVLSIFLPKKFFCPEFLCYWKYCGPKWSICYSHKTPETSTLSKIVTTGSDGRQQSLSPGWAELTDGWGDYCQKC